MPNELNRRDLLRFSAFAGAGALATPLLAGRASAAAGAPPAGRGGGPPRTGPPTASWPRSGGPVSRTGSSR